MTRKILALTIVATFAIVGCSKKDDNKGKKKPAPKGTVKKDPVKKDPPPKKDPPKVKEPKVKPEIALVVIHKVKDFDKWLEAFKSKENQMARRKAGVLMHHVSRAVKKKKKKKAGNTVVVYLAGKSKEKLEAFAASPELKEAMKTAGVKGKPEMRWLTPVSHNMKRMKDKSKDPAERKAAREARFKLAGLVVTHKVKDFDKWKAVYDGADELRTANGIVGHAVYRSVKDPDTVVVFHQADTVKTLRKFTKLKGLKKAMKKGGVKGKPTFMYVEGVTGKFYHRRGKHMKHMKDMKGMKKDMKKDDMKDDKK